MPFIQNLQQMLPALSSLYQELEIEENPDLPEPIKEAALLIDQGLEDYDPLFYDNESTVERLHSAAAKLDALEDKQRDENYYILRVYIDTLLAAREINRGEWKEAEEQIEKARVTAQEYIDQKQSALSSFLLACVLFLKASVDKVQRRSKDAFETYLDTTLSFLNAFLLDTGQYEKSLCHAKQRAHKAFADLAMAQLAESLSFQNYLAAARIGEQSREETF